MKWYLEKKYINTVFVLAIIILLLVNYLIYVNVTERFDDEKLSLHAMMIIKVSEELLNNLNQAETNRRGYLITDNPDFLNGYYSSIKELDSIYFSLKKITSAEPKDKAMIDSMYYLISDRKDLLEESIEIQETKGKNLKLQTDFIKRGKIKQDKIVEIISRFQEQEENNYKKIDEESDNKSKYTLANLIIGTFISIVIIILIVLLLNRNISLRKKSEKALAENRKWLSIVLSGIGDGIIATNKRGDITYINQAALSITGWQEIDALNKPVESVLYLVTDDLKNRLDNPVYEVLKNHRPAANINDATLLNKFGKQIPIDCKSAPIKDENDSLLGVVLVFDDISERKTALEELSRSQKFIQSIADSIPNIMYVFELKGPRMIYTNHQIVDKLGYTNEDLKIMGTSFLVNVLHPDDYERTLNIYERYEQAKDNEIIENEYRLKNAEGNWRWFHSRDIVFSRDDKGKPFSIIGTALDITERKEMEEELKRDKETLEERIKQRTSDLNLINNKLQSEITEKTKIENVLVQQEKFLRAIIDINPNLIFAKDWHGRFTLANKAVADIYGTTVENLFGKTDYDFNRNKEEVEHFLNDDREVMLNGISKLIPEEPVSNSLTGEIRYYQTTKIPFDSFDGSKQVLGVSTDITIRKLAEVQLKKSLDDKEALLQEIHHRVKNNLQLIVSLLKLQSKYINDPKDAEIFNKSRARVETMSIIHEKLYKSLDFAKVNLGNYIRDLAGHLMKVYGGESSRINLTVESDELEIGLDSVIPCGLIINELLSNSLKHAFVSFKSGEITIHLSVENGFYFLIYEDNGIGISENIDFRKTNTLGLQLVITLVEQLDGAIELLQSETGTAFKIRFQELKYKERITNNKN